MAQDMPGHVDLAVVRVALRAELQSRHYDVASDTLSTGASLYIAGDGDLARALFEFKSSADQAWETMYEGSWTSGMPSRFAVLPSSESGAPVVELLQQARMIPLFFEWHNGEVAFCDLDAKLAESLSG